MARKRNDSMKEAADQLIRAAKDELVEQEGSFEDLSATVPVDELPEAVKTLHLASFPSADGYHGLIYRIDSNGTWVRMDYHIEAPELIPDGDLEAEIQRIAKQKKWISGEYRVLIKKAGEKQNFLNKRVIIESQPQVDTVRSPMREGFDILDDAMRITERMKTPQIDVNAFGQTILQAVETGRNMVPSKEGNGPDTQLINLIEKLSPIIVPFLTRPPLDENSIIEKIVTRLKADIPKEDNLTALVKLKDGLGLKFAHEGKKEDSLDSVKRVTDIVSALRPLTGAASGEPPSTLSLVLEHLPKLVEPLLSTFKEFAEAKKMEMQLRMDQYYGGERSAQIESGKRNLPAPRIHPFATRIIKAVNESDESYFDMMRQQISRFYGQHVIDGLIDGSLTSDLVIETIHTELGVPLNLPNLKSYLDKFVKYLLGKNELENGKGILAECKMCHTQYDFPNIKAWEADGKKCEDCQADLELVKREGEA